MMQQPKNGHQGWQARLDTGEWVLENPSPPAPGELSSWQQLLLRCTSESLRIVNLQIVRGGVKVSALPRCEGYMQAYESRMSNRNHQTLTVQGVGSIVGNTVFICWLDAQGHVSQEVRDLSDVWVHTTQRALVDVLTPRRS